MTMRVDILLFAPKLRKEIDALTRDYQKRLRRFKGEVILKAPAKSSQNIEKQKAQEADIIQKHSQNYDKIILLDEAGDNMNSPAFANMLDHFSFDHQRVLFVVGGDQGLCDSLKTSHHRKLSFGKMTWPHQWIPLMLIEQIYRAETILSGHPYHK
jgi:23S rRNA (pseudouridine1915-N3)-methyltransferase